VSDNPTITISVDPAWANLAAVLATTPKDFERAEARAFRALGVWVGRQVSRAVAKVIGATQKNLRSLGRVRITRSPKGVDIWIGTNPVAVHKLGKVTWTPYRGAGSRPKARPKAPGRGRGARVGKNLYPGSWSWGAGSQTGELVMRRSTAGAPQAQPQTQPGGRDGRGRFRRAVTQPTDRAAPLEVVTADINEPVQARMRELTPVIQARLSYEMQRALRAVQYATPRAGRS